MSIADHHNVNLVPSGSLHSHSAVQWGEGCIVSRARGKKHKNVAQATDLYRYCDELMYSAIPEKFFQIYHAKENWMNVIAGIIFVQIEKNPGICYIIIPEIELPDIWSLFNFSS